MEWNVSIYIHSQNTQDYLTRNFKLILQVLAPLFMLWFSSIGIYGIEMTQKYICMHLSGYNSHILAIS